MAYKKGDYQTALKEFKEAAEQGEALAQFGLGFMYYKGDGVLQDYTEAASWYLKAAEQGDAMAQSFLGFMCREGSTRTGRWKAGMRQFSLGQMYRNGEGVPKDYAQAMSWYLKAAEQGEASAQFNLGLMYEKGRGVPQDDGQAVVWYKKAAEQSHAIAQYNLGVMYAKGVGMPQNDKLAISHLPPSRGSYMRV
ncbi:MAG: sel1 repeat family protein [Moraxellaceae bacterium]|nr:sel1 repeat family protein [Moraxellaceae bacterium]